LADTMMAMVRVNKVMDQQACH